MSWVSAYYTSALHFCFLADNIPLQLILAAIAPENGVCSFLAFCKERRREKADRKPSNLITIGSLSQMLNNPTWSYEGASIYLTD